MSLQELLPPGEQAEWSSIEGEAIDLTEQYLRLFLGVDRDGAEEFLEGLIQDDFKRTLIRLNALTIESTLLEQYSSGKNRSEKLDRLVQEYRTKFLEIVEKESSTYQNQLLLQNLAPGLVN